MWIVPAVIWTGVAAAHMLSGDWPAATGPLAVALLCCVLHKLP